MTYKKRVTVQKYSKNRSKKVWKKIKIAKTFAVLVNYPSTNVLSDIAKVTGVYESFPEEKYYTKELAMGKRAIIILNNSKHLKHLFHSAIAWIDNSGIYQRFGKLDRKFCKLFFAIKIQKHSFVFSRVEGFISVNL